MQFAIRQAVLDNINSQMEWGLGPGCKYLIVVQLFEGRDESVFVKSIRELWIL